MEPIMCRAAKNSDLQSILTIYNEGIEDRIATLETEPKDLPYITEWFDQHQDRYPIMVAERAGEVVGWVALNPYNGRCAYAGVAELSIYVSRENRGKGIGSLLLSAIEGKATEKHFHKIVLLTFSINELGQRLYRKYGYREVGVFMNQGLMDGKLIDVMAMEKLLTH